MSKQIRPDSSAPLPDLKLKELAAELLLMAESLVHQWLPGGMMRGHEYQCASVQGGAGSSFSVNVNSGNWADFASGEKGRDLIGLYKACFGMKSMGHAAVQIARELGLEEVAGVVSAPPGTAPPKREPRPALPPAAPKVDREGWKTMMPVPPHAPAATFKHPHRRIDDIAHTATYQMGGQLLGYVVRFTTSDGGKETLPYTWCISERDGSCAWKWKTWDEPRPLYVPAGSMPGLRTVVLVEGEKKADALHALLEAAHPGIYLVASWVGGCNGWKKALWDWLAGCNVLLWPDCDAKREKLTKAQRDVVSRSVAAKAKKPDSKLTSADCERLDKDACEALQAAQPLLPQNEQPGMKAMLGIGALLAADHGCTVQLLPIPEPGAVDDGWDCGDAINTDGWDAARVLAFFGQANELPAGHDAAAAGGAGGGGKKPPADRPGSPEAHESGDGADGSIMVGGKRIPKWLAYYYDADKSRWFTSRKMVIDCLRNDALLCNVLGLNQLSNTIDARLAWPWLHGKAGPITGSIDLMLGSYLTDTYGLPSIPLAALTEAIATVAHARPFHPIREWLQGLQHDGKTRIDGWLIYALGESPQTLAAPLCEYLRLVGRFWLLGMVNRVMEPGCKFDYCPVLEGPGGYKKSWLVEVLSSTAFYSDTQFDVSRGKEGQEQLQGLWLYEVAELSHFSKADVDLIKAFITAKVDRYRPAYGRVVESFSRQCVLTGTTNNKKYLKDRTGNRRFWPIPVTKVINTEFVIKFRDQLFAEAYQLYLANTQFTPSPEDEARLFVPMQESRLIETAVISELMAVLTRPSKTDGPSAIVNELTEFVTMAEMCMALSVDAAKATPGTQAEIRGFFEHEGWEYCKKQRNGVRAHGWARPAVWPRPDAIEAAAAPTNTPAVPLSSAGEFLKQQQEADDAPF